MGKVINDIEKMVAVCDSARATNRTIAFTNGCFDILHIGHIHILEQSKQLGDIVIVGINSDDSVKRLKGENRPINNIGARMKMLSALSCVDYVIAFPEDTPLRLIQAVRPQVLIKGGDYTIENIIGADFVKSYGGKSKSLNW